MRTGTDDRDLLDRLVRRYPPRRYRVEEYKRWFPTTAGAMSRYLERFVPEGAAPAADPRRGTVALVVVPWVGTPVPWYSIMLGIGLARRGRPVVLVWDDTGFPEPRLAEQADAIAGVMTPAARRFPVVRLSTLDAAPPDAADGPLVRGLADLNVAWRRRGAPRTEADDALAGKIERSLAGSLPKIRAALAATSPEVVVVPGGIYGTSGLFLRAGADRGCRVATFDVDRDTPQVCVQGIAAQNMDVPLAFHELWAADAAVRHDAVTVARAEFTRRTETRDGYGFQLVPARGEAGTGEVAALVPLNVEWDSSSLGRHVPFRDTTDWLTSTVAEVLRESAGVVVVRQHPSERRPLQKSGFDVGAMLREAFGDEPRVRFVAADDPTSTYDILDAARVVLPFVSTIGIEAAAVGKPVVLAGACYYADLGFAWSATTRDDYLALVRRGLRGDLPLLADQVERAWLCYYLTAVRNRFSSDFTAHPDSFWHWCRQSPDSLFSQPEVADILQALDDAVPLSLLRHRRAIGEGA